MPLALWATPTVAATALFAVLLLIPAGNAGIASYRVAVTPAELQGRVGEFPAETGVPVDTAWDIGIGDYTSIWCFQRLPDRIRLVHYVQDCGEGLPFYVNELSRLRALHN